MTATTVTYPVTTLGPLTQAHVTTSKAAWDASRAVAEAEEALERAKITAKTALTRHASTAAQRETDRIGVIAALEDARNASYVAEDNKRGADIALATVRANRYDRRDEALRQPSAFGQITDPNTGESVPVLFQAEHFYLRRENYTEGSRYKMALGRMDGASTVQVYGPVEWTHSTSGVVHEGAHVSWSQFTPRDLTEARRYAALIALAVQLAEYLDAKDATWRAEDLED